MFNEKVSILALYVTNILLFLIYVGASYIRGNDARLWFILLVLATISGFETILFYIKSDSSFDPLPSGTVLGIAVLSVAMTLVLIGATISILAITS